LMIACVLASIMDNLSVFMVSFAGIYTNSIHVKLFPRSSERALLGANRIAGVAFALVVLPLSYAFTDMPAAMRFAFKTVPLMGIAFFLAVLWRRANRYGAVASFVAALAAMLFSQYQLGWSGDAGLPKTILLYLVCGTLAGCVASLLTPAENQGRTYRFFLLLRTPIGQEQVLRDAGLVEIPGTGSFEEPKEESLPEGVRAPMLPNATPGKQTVYGFLWVAVVALALIGLVKAIAYWLQYG
jgi:Na+/proline symporter